MIRSIRFNSTQTGLKKTALHDLHVELGGNMVPFAGYSMPVVYKGQSHIESHKWTRSHAGLFDVSHMLQSTLQGKGAINLLHKVTPTDFQQRSPGVGTLSVLLNPEGGIVDDTLITKQSTHDFYIVTNAACAENDSQFLLSELQSVTEAKWTPIRNRSLLALQGPDAHRVLKPLLAWDQSLTDLYFGHRRTYKLFNGTYIDVARSGYTGEDGFEISIPNESASDFVRSLLNNQLAKPIGLAARDSLRLEAGLCLYGNELNESITPVEAALSWVISKNRRNITEGVKFNGYEKIMAQLNNKTHRDLRVGYKYQTKGPAARTGSKIFLPGGKTEVGHVTSGSASPSLDNLNIGQGRVLKPHNKRGSNLLVQVRNKLLPIELVKMPFIPSHYYKG